MEGFVLAHFRNADGLNVSPFFNVEDHFNVSMPGLLNFTGFHSLQSLSLMEHFWYFMKKTSIKHYM